MATQQTQQKFRSLEEIRKVVKDMLADQHIDSQLVDKTTRILAKVVTAAQDFKVMNITDSKQSQTRRKRTINVDFPIVKVPNAKELMKSYDLAEALSEKYKYAMNLENEVRMNFSKFAQNKNVQDTLGSITKLKQSLESNLHRLFQSLNQVANGHAPKEYLKFVQALADELINNRHIECDSGKTMTYAAISKGEKGEKQLVFAGYIILINAVSDEGKVAPTLYVVVKWTVGGDVEVFVEHEFFAPTLLSGGTTVENTREAIKVVADQLSLEGFSSQIGNLPVSMQIKQPASGLSPELFSAAEFIDKITADEDELTFTVKPAGMKNIDELKMQLFLEVKSMLKHKRSTKMRMRQQGNKVSFTFSGLDQSGGINRHDLDFLAEKYKLKETQLRKISNIINGE